MVDRLQVGNSVSFLYIYNVTVVVRFRMDRLYFGRVRIIYVMCSCQFRILNTILEQYIMVTPGCWSIRITPSKILIRFV